MLVGFEWVSIDTSDSNLCIVLHKEVFFSIEIFVIVTRDCNRLKMRKSRLLSLVEVNIKRTIGWGPKVQPLPAEECKAVRYFVAFSTLKRLRISWMVDDLSQLWNFRCQQTTSQIISCLKRVSSMKQAMGKEMNSRKILSWFRYKFKFRLKHSVNHSW